MWKNENILKINSNNNTITLCQECSTQITKKLKIMKSEQEEYIANKDKFAKNFHGKIIKNGKVHVIVVDGVEIVMLD